MSARARARARSALLVVAVAAAAGCGAPAPAPAESPGLEDAAKERIRRFWETLRAAKDEAREGRHVEAVARFEQALELEPDHADALYELGASLAQLGRFDEAIARYERLVLRSTDGSPRGNAQLGALHSSLEPGAPLDFARARAALERQNAANREESGSYLALGELAMLEGDFAQARRHYQAALGLNHTSVPGHYELGLVELEAGNVAQAARLFARALTLGKPQQAHRGVLQEGDTKAEPKALHGDALRARRALGICAALEPALPEEALLAIEAAPLGPRQAQATWQPRVERLALPAGAEPRDLAWGDADGDGESELAIADEALGLVVFGRERAAFQDRTSSLGIASAPGGTHVSWSDFDADGRTDLYLLRGDASRARPPALYRNEPGGFRELSDAAGLAAPRQASVAAFADLDADSDLDLVEAGGGPAPLALWRNEGGRFTHVEGAFATPAHSRPATAIAIADLDGDGANDLVASFWQAPLAVYRNDPAQGFRDVTWSSGIDYAGPLRALVAIDLDRDARPEIVAIPWQEPGIGELPERPAGVLVWRNRGDGTFEELRGDPALAGALPCMAMAALAHGADALLFVASGGPRFDLREPNLLLRVGAGLGFERIGIEAPGRIPGSTIALAAHLGAGGPRAAIVSGGLHPAGRRHVDLLRFAGSGPTLASRPRDAGQDASRAGPRISPWKPVGTRKRPPAPEGLLKMRHVNGRLSSSHAQAGRQVEDGQVVAQEELIR